ncbi:MULTISPECIES: DUF6884 domain-containing protein [Thermoprotei]|uniref:DUF6884 domain-containing protein n=1 Tax=Thermoprotei TaxID=183924 RepID=UPI0031614340
MRVVSAGKLSEELASRGIDFRRVRRVLVVTRCTRRKHVDEKGLNSVLNNYNLPLPGFDIENEPKYREVLKQFVKPAREMYGGTFTRVMEIVDALRSYGKHVDVYIISGRYGLISENDEIVPYDAPLNKMNPSEIREWSRKRDVEEKLWNIIQRGEYDAYTIVLSEKYALAICEILRFILEKKNAIIITAKSAVDECKNKENVKALVLPSSIPGLRQLRSLKLLKEVIYNHHMKKD